VRFPKYSVIKRIVMRTGGLLIIGVTISAQAHDEHVHQELSKSAFLSSSNLSSFLADELASTGAPFKAGPLLTVAPFGDLDTVMPGLALYDFGDMVRTTTSPAKEDERDLSKVNMQFPMFESLARGYLTSASEFLTPAERSLLTLPNDPAPDPSKTKKHRLNNRCFFD
jgi:hypothetical protein